MNYLDKENYTATSVFNYNNKYIARFVAYWNIWVILVEFPLGRVKYDDGINNVILFNSSSNCGEVKYDVSINTVILFHSPSGCGEVKYGVGINTVIVFDSQSPMCMGEELTQIEFDSTIFLSRLLYV